MPSDYTDELEMKTANKHIYEYNGVELLLNIHILREFIIVLGSLALIFGILIGDTCVHLICQDVTIFLILLIFLILTVVVIHGIFYVSTLTISLSQGPDINHPYTERYVRLLMNVAMVDSLLC